MSNSAQLPTVERLIEELKRSGRRYLTQDPTDTFVVRWFEGEVAELWAESHPSYTGFRVVELVITDLDDESTSCVFFDCEDENSTYIFCRVL